jgi:hypothetical protein
LTKLPRRWSRRSGRSRGRRGTIVDPGSFAAYTFTVVAAIGSLTILSAVVRRTFGSRRGRRELGAHFGDTDPGSHQAVEQLAGEVEALRDEVAGVRRELDEAQNRIDFTERLLAQVRTQGKLPAGGAEP